MILKNKRRQRINKCLQNPRSLLERCLLKLIRFLKYNQHSIEPFSFFSNIRPEVETSLKFYIYSDAKTFEHRERRYDKGGEMSHLIIIRETKVKSTLTHRKLDKSRKQNSIRAIATVIK